MLYILLYAVSWQQVEVAELIDPEKEGYGANSWRRLWASIGKFEKDKVLV